MSESVGSALPSNSVGDSVRLCESMSYGGLTMEWLGRSLLAMWMWISMFSTTTMQPLAVEEKSSRIRLPASIVQNASFTNGLEGWNFKGCKGFVPNCLENPKILPLEGKSMKSKFWSFKICIFLGSFQGWLWVERKKGFCIASSSSSHGENRPCKVHVRVAQSRFSSLFDYTIRVHYCRGCRLLPICVVVHFRAEELMDF